jgi:hypothetical protein
MSSDTCKVCKEPIPDSWYHPSYPDVCHKRACMTACDRTHEHG